jgi:hypothetical protein
MSYALRNTLVLLATLILLVAGGWVYFTYILNPTIEEQATEITRKTRENTQLAAKADNFVAVQERHSRKFYELDNHNKELLADNNVATVYDFLRSINRGLAYTSMNFSLRDSVLNRDHGIIRVQLDGEGTYRGLFNFLSILEQSKPITKITELRLAPKTALDELNRVQYMMNVEFYYARGTSKSDPELLINTSIAPRIYNPFYPLVHGIPENSDGLTNVEQSRLVGLVRNGAYVVDQNNQMRLINVGSQVYLGTLVRVNMNEETATFRLNKGGIADIVVLKINESN